MVGNLVTVWSKLDDKGEKGKKDIGLEGEKKKVAEQQLKD